MYKVTFEDGTSFEGGSPSESKWGEIPNLPIKSIEYSLTPFLTYLFSGFESYCHVVERVQGVNKGLSLISKVIIMGRTKNRVYQIMMDSTGSVFQLVVKDGQEYSPSSKIIDGKFGGWDNGRPLSGWKVGIVGGEPKLEKIKTQ